MPSETPGRSEELVSSAPHPVACVRSQSISLPNENFGANYRIQPLSFTSQPFLTALRYNPSRFEYGWLTRPYPEGFPPS
jgi:hypothetical protein